MNDTTIPEALIFGSPKPDSQCSERRAAYVVITRDGKVALIKSGRKHFLPGGGSLPGETPEATIVREVREELARPVRLLYRLGEATNTSTQPTTTGITKCWQYSSWGSSQMMCTLAPASIRWIGCR